MVSIIRHNYTTFCKTNKDIKNVSRETLVVNHKKLIKNVSRETFF